MITSYSRKILRLEVLRPIIQQRNIFVASNEKTKRRPKKSQDANRQFLQSDSDRKLREEELKYKKRLDELKSLTKSVSSLIRRKEEYESKKKLADKLPSSDADVDSKKVYEALQISDKQPVQELAPPNAAPDGGSIVVPKNSLVVPSIKLPSSIQERLGLSIKFLVSKTNQNWPMVLYQLKQADGLKGISTEDTKELIKAIPPEHLKQVVPDIEAMIAEANIEKTSRIMNLLMTGISHGSSLSNEEINQLETYCEELRSRNKKKVLSRDTYTLMIQAYGKNNNLEAINRCLEEMKELKLQVSPAIMSNMLTTMVYKTRDHKQAVQIFDSMKFFSQATKPSTKAYQDIIVSYINNDDIERGLDLYQEMITEGVPLNQNIVVALARGCSSREELKFKAWDFMFEVYNNNWTPSLETYEYMIYLASRDGDLALSRALYLKLMKSQSTSKRSFSFLLLAYSKSKIKNEKGYEPALLNFHEKGRVFRRNILMDSDFTSIETGFPFLPIQDLTTKDYILAESSAIWAYTLQHNIQFINNESITNYLNIAAEVGDLQDFIDRFDNSTFFDKTGLPGKRTINESEEIDQTALMEIIGPESFSEETNKVSIHKSPALDSIEQSNSAIKYPRTALMYVIALKVAGKFKNYEFCHKIWTERGSFRKTNQFRNLPTEEKDRLDFQFASSMILALTRMNLLQDALAILLSTEYQFKWTWKELTHLHKAAVEIGDDKTCRTVRGIAKRAQLNFAGKIRRKDFKRYLMERGF